MDCVCKYTQFILNDMSVCFSIKEIKSFLTVIFLWTLCMGSRFPSASVMQTLIVTGPFSEVSFFNVYTKSLVMA